MKTVPASVAAKQFGALLEHSDAGPVTITKDGRPRAVILCARLFEAYSRAYEKESDERFADLVHKSLDLIKEGKLGKGQRALALARRLRLNDEQPGEQREAEALLEAGEK